jgi:excisionase family DNA binding protein
MDEKTISVPEAGRRYFGLGKNASYDAVKRGELPAIKIGGRIRVPIIALEKMLETPRSGK